MQLLANALIAGSLAALVAGGLALVYGVMGVFNLALGQMVLFGGYCTWWLHQVAGWALFPSIIGGLIAGGILAFVAYRICITPFVKHHRFLPLVTTIALSMILDGLLQLLFGETPRNIIPGEKHMLELLDARISPEQLTLIVATLVLLLVFAWFFHTTPMGRRIRAVVQHEHAAQSLGIPAARLRTAVFIASGMFAAAAGIFMGIDQTLTPVIGFGITIKAYAAIIAGGKGNIWGAVLCAYLIALLEQLLVGIHWFGLFYVPAGYQQTVALVLIIVFLLIKPSGIFGSIQRSA